MVFNDTGSISLVIDRHEQYHLNGGQVQSHAHSM